MKRAAAAAAALTLGACDDGEPSSQYAAPPSTPDAGSGDATPPDARRADAAAPDATGGDADAALDADAGLDAMAPDAAAREPEWPITKGPWVHLRGRDGALIRFETRTEAPREVTVTGPGGPWVVAPTIETREIEWRWPPGQTWERADRPGLYTLQTVRLTDLAPGAYTWRVEAEDGPIEGGFRIVPPSAPVRIGWVSDTMWPVLTEVGLGVAASAPDVLLHGGDLQYRSNPIDTWHGLFLDLAAVHRSAPFHACVGNHEFETATEFDELYGRLFGVQAEGNPGMFHRVDAGAARVLMLNSEGGLTAGPQWDWLEAELIAAAADPAVAVTIVAFHRPYFTFSQHTGGLAERARLHPLFVEHGVRLVLNGHVHAYERFEVDGVTYAVDGGAGAVLYDPDEEIEAVREARPSEIDLRVAVSQSHGWITLDVAPDGVISGTRWLRGGEVVDRFEVRP